MHQNKIDLMDRGWESMHEILDREMPQKNDRRRLFLYWLIGCLAIATFTGVLAYSVFQPQLSHSNPNIVSAETNASNLSDLDNPNQAIATPQQQAPAQTASESPSSDPTSQSIADHTDASPKPNTHADSNQGTTSPPAPSRIPSTNEPFESNNHSIVTNNDENLAIRTTTTSQSLPSISDSSPTISESSPTISEPNSPANQTTLPNQESEPISQPIANKPTQAIHEAKHPFGNKNLIDGQNDKDATTNQTDVVISPSLLKDTKQTNDAVPKQNKNTISAIQLMPRLQSYLTLPETSVLAMSIPLAPFSPPVIKPDYVLNRQWEIGLSGLYAHKAPGLGFEVLGRLRQELSKRLSVHVGLGAGCLDISNSANLGELSDLSSTRNPLGDGIETGGVNGPAGPTEAPGTENDPGDTIDTEEEFSIPDFELTTSQLQSLSLANINSLKYLTINSGIQYAFSRHFHLGASVGLDYMIHTSFNRVFIIDEKFLATEASGTNNFSNVQLEAGSKILPFTEAYTSMQLSEIVGIKASYKYYLKEIYPDLGNTWLNQFKLGVFLSLGGKNR